MITAAIIGAGIGGIATAIRLAAKGYTVDVFEKEPFPGGKLAELWQDDFRFDLGPSLLLEPEKVEELFVLMGEDPADHLRFRKIETIGHYYWPDGTVLVVPSDPRKFAYESRRVFNEDSSAIPEYLVSSGKLTSQATPLLLDQPVSWRKALLNSDFLRRGSFSCHMDWIISLHSRNARSFKDPRLVQLFDRYAANYGSNPYQAPAILRMAAYTTHQSGAFYPAGGMYSIARELTSLAIRHGVRFHFNSAVQRVNLNLNGDRAAGIRMDGRDLEYSVVVSDADINTFFHSGMAGHAPQMKLNRPDPSSSALIFCWGVAGSYPSLDLQNILFSANYREEMNSLFKKKKMYPDPTIYIFISSRQVPGDAPPDYENWCVRVDVPENNGQDWTGLVPEMRAVILEKIERMLKINLAGKIVTEHIRDPRSIELRTASFHGTRYGDSYNRRFSVFSRHPNHRSSIKGLYFAGGSVHPGGGIPGCLASAKIVAGLI